MNSHNPCGSGWIGMVGEMVMINVGLNDQVRQLKLPFNARFCRSRFVHPHFEMAINYNLILSFYGLRKPLGVKLGH